MVGQHHDRPERHQGGELALPAHLVKAKKRYKAQARAERTREAYARAWTQFEAWCTAHGRLAAGHARDR
jgi:hypothetical protein